MSPFLSFILFELPDERRFSFLLNIYIFFLFICDSSCTLHTHIGVNRRWATAVGFTPVITRMHRPHYYRLYF